ncbi:MAG: hypothetical protein MUO26_10300 [Methanotrichaceae archaeon]|nr:hypothetical protein [Methanotrichaceae archaeon]
MSVSIGDDSYIIFQVDCLYTTAYAMDDASGKGIRYDEAIDPYHSNNRRQKCLDRGLEYPAH